METSHMVLLDKLAESLGYGFIVFIGGLIGYRVRLLIDHRLRKELEGYKHTLAVLGKRLDFLHQERGKTALKLVRLMKIAKTHLKLLVDPHQLGPVDQEQACEDAHVGCTQVHNLIAESSFLFPKPLEDRMLKVQSELWSILDEATILLKESKRKGDSPFNDPNFSKLWKKLRAEFDPLEAAMIAEIQILLGANGDDAGGPAKSV